MCIHVPGLRNLLPTPNPKRLPGNLSLQYADCTTGQLPLDMDDEDITSAGLLSSPRTNATDPPTLMTGFVHAIKLRRLWTKISDNLYPPLTSRCGNDCAQRVTVESLRQELDKWRADTPDQLDYSRSHPLSVFTSKSWFQLAYDHSILLLYRHYMIGTHRNRPSAPDGGSQGGAIDSEAMERALEECAVRARDMCLLYRRVYQSSSVQFTWGSLHILFLGGLTYLYCLWRSDRVRNSARQSDVVTTCMACTTVLIIIAERWNLATSYRDIFEALSQRTINMVCNDGHKQGTMSLPALGTGPGMESQAPPGASSPPPLQDWIMGLDDLDIPQESEWLVQELLQGVQEF